LLDRFDAPTLKSMFKALDSKTLSRVSKGAFAHHKHFSFERYFTELEQIAVDALSEFDGQNRLQVYPDLMPVKLLRDENKRLKAALKKTEGDGAEGAIPGSKSKKRKKKKNVLKRLFAKFGTKPGQ
jgi:hypothetical protein